SAPSIVTHGLFLVSNTWGSVLQHFWAWEHIDGYQYTIRSSDLLREKEFIEAAKVMGFGSGRIIFQHIIPNVLGPVAIISAGNFATAILLEAGLSFLGIGVQPPVPSWGTMIKDHYGYIIMDKAYLAILPGIAIMLLVLAFTIIGNGLRDAMDTKSMD
ncbi:MAG: ABC transporter permease, partial [Bacteroidales bacterium]|nr:ABC transporter permease [Bacteroidales bacterium]